MRIWREGKLGVTAGYRQWLTTGYDLGTSAGGAVQAGDPLEPVSRCG